MKKKDRVFNTIEQAAVQRWTYKGWNFISTGGEVYISTKDFEEALDSLKLKLK